MENFIIILVIAITVSAASTYIYKHRKEGAKCIGCPCAKNCSHNCNNHV